MQICSVLCCWLAVRNGHLLFGSAPFGLVMPLPWVPKEKMEKGAAMLLERVGGAPVRTPCPLSLLCQTSGLTPESWAVTLLRLPGEVFGGVLVPICFELVYSVLPSKISDVYCASLFFVHPFEHDFCSHH